MSVLAILEFPDARLRTVAAPVTQFDDALQQLIDDMLETMYAARGIGLAASQVDRHVQVIVMDLSEAKDTPQIFINPKLTVVGDELESYDEGCLSVPGFYESVTRPKRIKIQAQDQHGVAFECEDDDMLAICIQHEMDHLKGRLFVDYLSALKRNRIRAKLEKAHKEAR